MKSIITKDQTLKFTANLDSEDKSRGIGTIELTLRYDDSLGNGHNTFSMVVWAGGNKPNSWGGMDEEAMRKYFPQFAEYIKWHCTSTDAPMHYVANSMYSASSKDCWGKEKGEPYRFESQIEFTGVFPGTFKFSEAFTAFLAANADSETFKIVEVPYKGKLNLSPNYTFEGFECSWYKAPFKDIEKAKQSLEAFNTLNFEVVQVPTSWGEGKEPDLEAARKQAVWPEAELEDFTKEKLEARLPALMEDFKRDMEELGFIY